MKILGVFLGTEEFERKNWEGVLDKVCTRLSKWTQRECDINLRSVTEELLRNILPLYLLLY